MDALSRSINSLSISFSEETIPQPAKPLELRAYHTAKSSNSLSMGYDSDEELIELTHTPVFSRENVFPASTTTVICRNTPNSKTKNIKGGTLIQIAHAIIQIAHRSLHTETYLDEVDAYYESFDPRVHAQGKDGICFVRSAKDWPRSLGGWKGMMPSQELKEYKTFLGKDVGIKTKFKEALIFEDSFFIEENRLHICPTNKKFFIGNFEVTKAWIKKLGQWESYTRTDLSYSQITKAIDEIKRVFSLNDAQLAQFQLDLLDNHGTLFLVDRLTNSRVEIFFHYLNALMFGIEATGLNAGLLTSLMTLDLIKENKFTYKEAFNAGKDGGYYPFATFGENRGTYTAREELLSKSSMKDYRENPGLSPVAVKEAILIKFWLKTKNLIDESLSFDAQKENIEKELSKLTIQYFKLDQTEFLWAALINSH